MDNLRVFMVLGNERDDCPLQFTHAAKRSAADREVAPFCWTPDRQT
jgi:hypothetical protein